MILPCINEKAIPLFFRWPLAGSLWNQESFLFLSEQPSRGLVGRGLTGGGLEKRGLAGGGLGRAGLISGILLTGT